MGETLRIVVYGKGGIGKSTVSSNLSMALAGRGLKVLHVGCDPKHDSTYTLVPQHPIPTLIERFLADDIPSDGAKLVTEGRRGVHCLEAGGPTPGTGCAGRGVLVAAELIERAGLTAEGRYDVALFDVVGDVVCGGFAAPLQRGLGRKVFIVVSEDIMSLYAGNNVARVVVEYASGGVRLGGLIVNRVADPRGLAAMDAFAERLGTRIVAALPVAAELARAEYERLPLMELAPESAFARGVEGLATVVLGDEEGVVPTPLDEPGFERFVREVFYAPRQDDSRAG